MRSFRHRSNTLFLMGSQLSCGYFVFGNTPLDSWPPTSVPQASLYLPERANLAGWRPSHLFSYLNSSHNIISIDPFFPADTSVYKWLNYIFTSMNPHVQPIYTRSQLNILVFFLRFWCSLCLLCQISSLSTTSPAFCFHNISTIPPYRSVAQSFLILPQCALLIVADVFDSRHPLFLCRDIRLNVSCVVHHRAKPLMADSICPGPASACIFHVGPSIKVSIVHDGRYLNTHRKKSDVTTDRFKIYSILLSVRLSRYFFPLHFRSLLRAWMIPCIIRFAIFWKNLCQRHFPPPPAPAALGPLGVPRASRVGCTAAARHGWTTSSKERFRPDPCAWFSAVVFSWSL